MNKLLTTLYGYAPHPILLCGLAVAPLLLLAGLRRTYPAANFLFAALAVCALNLLVFVRGELIGVVLFADVLLLGVAIGDWFTLPASKHFRAERRLQRVASLRARHRVELTVVHSGPRRARFWVRDDVPAEFDTDIDEFDLVLGPRRVAELVYEMQPTKRGAYRMQTAYFCLQSLLGFWRRYVDAPCVSEVHVYPDMKQLGEYALLARTNRLSLIGVRRTRRVGQDNEFERLRDFTRDDNYKNIDWRSTARRRKLTVKDFQANQSQRIIFLLDCGRMMTNEALGLSLLDHALNSMLMLSYVALSQGDSVGLVCFSDRIHSYTPPRSSKGHMNRLLHASFNQSANLVESRYDQAFLHLGAHCSRRALVILITNVIDAVNSAQIQDHLSNLTGKHLPLGVLLRDAGLFERVESSNLYRAAAAADILSWRSKVIGDLERRGVLTLDVFPSQMTAQLINRYLEVKARRLL